MDRTKGPARPAQAPSTRLSPEMASFRALVLRFVRDYFAAWGQSPSYGEIAAALGSNRTRVRRAVLSLARAGLILRTPGTRGLALPDEVERARRILARVTNPALLPPPVLDYPAALAPDTKGTPAR